MKLNTLAALCVAISFCYLCQGEPLDFTHVIRVAEEKYSSTYDSIKIGQFPEKTLKPSGKWNLVDASNWVSGFYPGCLWYLYELTQNSTWMDRAVATQVPLAKEASSTADHDVGFRIMCSYGNAYRLTNDKKYQSYIYKGAASLATRFNPKVGVIKSWNWDTYPVIIDNMMNLNLLFEAKGASNGQHYYDVADTHSATTLVEHFRYPEMSTYHMVDYDVSTGIPRTKGSVQGYSFNSTWARGQAWAVYGFTQVYGYTRDQKYLDAAIKAADYYLEHGFPSDYVPYWDFNDPRQPNIWRDTSAASTIASAFIMISQHQQDPIDNKYFHAAEKILASLSGSVYLTDNSVLSSLLAHGTQHAPAGNYDTGIIFGDYYFLEAIVLYKKLTMKQ